MVIQVNSPEAKKIGKPTFELKIPGSSTRAEITGNNFPMNEERAGSIDTTDHISKYLRRTDNAAVRSEVRDSSLGIAAKTVHIERNVIVELAEACAKDCPTI